MKSEERCSQRWDDGRNRVGNSVFFQDMSLGGVGASCGRLKKIDCFSKDAVVLQEPTN